MVSRKGLIFHKEYVNTTEIGVTSPSNTWYVPITDTDVSEYGPFNKIRVINKSETDIYLRFNHTTDTAKYHTVPSGMMSVWDETDNLKYNNIAIQNISDTTVNAIGSIIVDIMKVN